MIKVHVPDALALLGLKTLQLHTLEEQCESLAADFTRLQAENEALKKENQELKDGRSQQANNDEPLH